MVAITKRLNPFINRHQPAWNQMGQILGGLTQQEIAYNLDRANQPYYWLYDVVDFQRRRQSAYFLIDVPGYGDTKLNVIFSFEQDQQFERPLSTLWLKMMDRINYLHQQASVKRKRTIRKRAFKNTSLNKVIKNEYYDQDESLEFSPQQCSTTQKISAKYIEKYRPCQNQEIDMKKFFTKKKEENIYQVKNRKSKSYILSINKPKINSK